MKKLLCALIILAQVFAFTLAVSAEETAEADTGGDIVSESNIKDNRKDGE
jgi:hypothetical protein